MLVTNATPIEKKGHFTREVVGAAAAMEAMKVSFWVKRAESGIREA